MFFKPLNELCILTRTNLKTQEDSSEIISRLESETTCGVEWCDVDCSVVSVKLFYMDCENELCNCTGCDETIRSSSNPGQKRWLQQRWPNQSAKAHRLRSSLPQEEGEGGGNQKGCACIHVTRSCFSTLHGAVRDPKHYADPLLASYV